MPNLPTAYRERIRKFEQYFIERFPTAEEEALDPHMVAIYGDPRSSHNEPISQQGKDLGKCAS